MWSGKVALLFGSEKFGLSNDDLSHCHWLLRIPTRVEHESMNLGQAVAVCLYELIRSEQAAVAEPREVREATAEQRELFTDLLLDLLRESGYLNPVTAESSELKLRRMIGRLHLTQADAYVWFGIIRQIRWRIRSGDSAAEGSPPPRTD
jgi:tRNA/rRNA methyltransferase